MTSVAPLSRRSGPALRFAICFSVAALCWSAAPAHAQFGWFGSAESNPQDAYDTIQSHGFRLAGPLMQNRDVYIADVFDRRQRRERLIISRDTGQILQRFMVDVGRGGPYADLSQPGPAVPRPRRPGPDFFSGLVHGFGEDNPPRPPVDVGTVEQEDGLAPPLASRPQSRPTRSKPVDIEPRVATRRDDAPVTSRALAPEPAPSASPQPPAAAAPPAAAPPVAAAPALDKVQPAAAPAPARATVVTTDPLRIPGSRDSAPKPAAPATPATTVAKSSPAAPATPPVAQATPAPVKAPIKPASAKDVPVAPLD